MLAHQMTTMLNYESGFNPTTAVEPFFAGMHTVRSSIQHQIGNLFSDFPCTAKFRASEVLGLTVPHAWMVAQRHAYVPARHTRPVCVGHHQATGV